METSIDPQKLWPEAEAEVSRGGRRNLHCAALIRRCIRGRTIFGNLPAQERENKIIVAVLDKIGRGASAASSA